MWSGGFEFGTLWASYLGPAGENTAHAHVAVQVAIGIETDPCIELQGTGMLAGPVLVVGPRVPHRLTPSARPLGLLYVAPQAPLASALLAAIRPATAAALPARLAAAVHGVGPSLWAVALQVAVGAAAPALDARLAAALHDATGHAGPGAIGRAAAAAGLSESRLRALARRQLHAPLSQWLLWHKLERAARAVAAGAGLAAAAAEGGFADQAHFTRTMKRMFGVTPAAAAAALR